MKLMKRNGFSLTSVCPLCGKTDETWEHVHKCGSIIAKISRQQKLQHLKNALVRKKTHPILLQRILAMIMQWTNNYAVTTPIGDSTLKILNESFLDQKRLGIGNIFCGIISVYFGRVHLDYYNKISANTVRFIEHEWNVTFIRALLNYSYGI